MQLDLDRVRANVREATTEDLLDRVTVYREGMEPVALDIIEAELTRRGVRSADIERHAEERGQTILMLPDGTAQPCSLCERPAVIREWGWHRLWGRFPIFPRYLAYCEEHRPPPPAPESDETLTP